MTALLKARGDFRVEFIARRPALGYENPDELMTTSPGAVRIGPVGLSAVTPCRPGILRARPQLSLHAQRPLVKVVWQVKSLFVRRYGAAHDPAGGHRRRGRRPVPGRAGAGRADAVRAVVRHGAAVRTRPGGPAAHGGPPVRSRPTPRGDDRGGRPLPRAADEPDRAGL